MEISVSDGKMEIAYEEIEIVCGVERFTMFCLVDPTQLKEDGFFFGNVSSQADGIWHSFTSQSHHSVNLN